MEEVRLSSRIIHPEVHSISRESVTTDDRTTLPFFTKYEQVVLIGTRAQELADGAKPLVSLEGINTAGPRAVWEIAEKELLEKKLGAFIIHRQFPNGKSEYWSANELSIVW